MPTPRSTRPARRLVTFAAALALFGACAALFLYGHTSAAAGLKYRSAVSGNWNAASTWETSVDGNTWIPAVATPTSADDTITVRNGHIVTVTAAVSADQLTVNSGGILSVAGGVAFTLDDGAGNDITVDNGGIFAAAGSVTDNGQAQINGTLRVDDGGFPGNGTGTYAYDQTTGTLFFNHTSGTYGVNNFNFWPTTNGPQNVAVGTADLQLNVARTVGLSFETSAGVFGANNLTIGANGTLTVFAGGFFSGSPTYASGSTLKYSTGTSYGRNGEWLPGATSGAGYPWAVQVSGNTTLDLPNGSPGSTFQTGGPLTINSGSTLSMGAMTAALTVLGDVVNQGTLKLSTALGGDLHVEGGWTASATGTLTPNSRAVFFDGTSTQGIAKPLGETFDYLVINKSAGNTVNLLNDVTVNAAGGNVLQLLGGTLDLRANTLKLNGGGGNVFVSGGARTVTSSTGTGTFAFNGAKSVTADPNSTLGFDANVSVNLSAGVNFGGVSTVGGKLSIKSGGFVDTNPPTYASGSTLEYDNGATYNAAAEFPATGVQNVKLNSTTLLNLNGDKTVPATFELGAHKVDTGAHTLTIGNSGSITNSTGYVIGTLQKSFSGASGDSFTFPVGTANGYSPVNADAVTGTGSLSVKATQTKQPNIPGTNALSRYWTLSGSGLTADLTFNYLDGDVVGNENNYQVFKYDGTFTAPAGQSVSPPDNSATVTGVSSFSDWTLAEPSATVPTLSGTKTVCASGCDYVNLTGASGLFAAVNASVLDGDLVAQIAGDLTEDGTNALNQWTETGGSGFTLTIEPADGTTRIISGNVAAGMIRLNGADRVTIDGRFNNAGRFLTFRNTSTSGATIALLNDASNNTVRSSVVEGAAIDPSPSTSPSVGVILFGAGATTGNDNDTVTDNQIRDRSDAVGVPTLLLLSAGSSASAANSGNTVSDNELFNFRNRAVHVSGANPGTSDSWTITGNTIYQTASRTGSLFGISVSASGSNMIERNTVHDLTASGSILRGINFVPTGSSTSVIARNRVYALSNTSDGTETSGVVVSAHDTTTVNVVNNMLSVVPAAAKDQFVFGVIEQGAGGTTFNLLHNSVLVGGTASGATPTWACLRNNIAASTHTSRNNVCFNNRTGGGANHFAAGDESTAGSFSSDYNIFVGTGAVAASNFFDYGTSDTGTPVSFATWQSSTGGDAHSQAANPGGDYTVANMFTSETDLHLNMAGTNPASNAGTPVGSVTKDFDDETRDTVIPDIGADEVTSTVLFSFSSATYSVGEGGGSVQIVVRRTGSSVGDVAVHYATSDGSASDGSDYTGASGTLTWSDGDTSDRSFNVDINDDGDYEGDETFNVALDTPAGGSLGTPSSAVVTINDNDPPPVSISIDDVTKAEGNAGTTAFVFNVTKTGTGAASVDFQTQDDSAEAGSDYASNSGTLNFDSADTTKQITVLVNGDTTPETDETFFVKLSNASGASITDDTGTGTISNDDESVSAGQFIISEFRLRGPGIPEPPPDAPRAAKSPKASAATAPKASASFSRCGGSKASVASGRKKRPHADVLSSVADAEPDTSPEANDEFIELYNNTDTELLVTTTDGSEGWAVAASDGLVRFIVPNGTVIPPRAHFLSLNLIGYSLYPYPAGDGSFGPPFAFGDFVIRGDGTTCFGYELDIPDNAGIALFRTSKPSNFSTDTRLDAVGSTAEANTLYKEGAGYPALAPADIAQNLEHSFFRSLCSFVGGVGCTTPGLPKDSGDNAADFLFADTQATQTAAGRRLGAPAPENLASPVQRNSQFGFALLDRTAPASSPPNRVRTFGEDTANNSTFGTLTVRRRLTNNTGKAVTAVRFRIIELTTAPSPAGTADLRARDADAETVTGVGDSGTCASTAGGAAPCDVPVYGATLEEPSLNAPSQPNGGGLNSSLSLGVITLDDPLPPGESINVQFLLGIQQTGSFRFLLNIEAVTEEDCVCPTKPAARAVRRKAPTR